jgi:hypothetical protein
MLCLRKRATQALRRTGGGSTREVSRGNDGSAGSPQDAPPPPVRFLPADPPFLPGADAAPRSHACSHVSCSTSRHRRDGARAWFPPPSPRGARRTLHPLVTARAPRAARTPRRDVTDRPPGRPSRLPGGFRWGQPSAEPAQAPGRTFAGGSGAPDAPGCGPNSPRPPGHGALPRASRRPQAVAVSLTRRASSSMRRTAPSGTSSKSSYQAPTAWKGSGWSGTTTRSHSRAREATASGGPTGAA